MAAKRRAAGRGRHDQPHAPAATTQAAITDRTAVLMRVHPSNFRVVGFTAEVALAELVELAHARGLIVLDDLGAGALVDLEQFGLPHEPTVPRVHRRRGRRGALQRRQAHRRQPGRHHRGPKRADRAHPPASAGARLPRGQDLPDGPGAHAAPVPRPGQLCRRAPDLPHAHHAGRDARRPAPQALAERDRPGRPPGRASGAPERRLPRQRLAARCTPCPASWSP